MKEKQENEARWKTKTGFENVLKKNDYSIHPKKPPQSVIDDLTIPYVEQMKETMAKMKDQPPFKKEDGKVDF